MRRFRLTLLVVVAGSMVAGVPARATFRGTNGLLVYQAQAGDHVQLFTIRPAGGTAKQLTSWTDSDATFPLWSPDGRKIVVTRKWGPNRARLYTLNADGTGLHAFDPTLRGPGGWFPDGKRLLLLKALRWTIVTAGGSGARPAGIPGSGDSPCVLPDGKHVAFIASLGRTDGKEAIFVGVIGGGNGSLKRITPWATYADKIDCSPDGTRIMFSRPGFSEGGKSSNVYTMKIDGTDLVQLTHEIGGQINAGADSWSPDGKKIAFASNRTGTYAIYTMNADGTGVTKLTKGEEEHAASWGRHP